RDLGEGRRDLVEPEAGEVVRLGRPRVMQGEAVVLGGRAELEHVGTAPDRVLARVLRPDQRIGRGDQLLAALGRTDPLQSRVHGPPSARGVYRSSSASSGLSSVQYSPGKGALP